MELGYLGYDGHMILMLWRTYNIPDLVELYYLGYGGTMISRIWREKDIDSVVGL